MLFMTCALGFEAKPLISHFNLQSFEVSPFPIYLSSSIGLIVTGVGKIQMAAAVGYLQAIMGNQKHTAWLNIGIAGHASFALGKGILAHQVFDYSSGRYYYPVFVVDRPVETATVWTVDRPEIHYKGEGVYEMEASAFWHVASRLTSAEFIHCYKIISDNQNRGASYLTKNHVEDLVYSHVNSIESFIHSLCELSCSLACLEISNETLDIFIQRWHFTSTEKIQLKSLLQRWKSNTNLSLEALLDEELFGLSQAQQVLKKLENRLYSLFSASYRS